MLKQTRTEPNTNTEARLEPAAVAALTGRLTGRLIRPGEADYDAARRVWNGLIDRRPALIVRCADAADVAAAVRFASAEGVPLSVRGGGHNVAGNAVRDGAVVIDLSEMRGVTVDAASRTAVVEGGATLGDLDRATQAHGLAAPVGVVSATGVAGLTLHGGLGWQTRKRGAAQDNLLAAEVVTADGRLRRASAGENPDLFWALRGGGGNFGVVTSFEFQLYPVGPEVWFAAVFYPFDKAGEILRTCREFLPSAPEELGAGAVLWTAPDEPFIPEAVRGEPCLVVLGCHTGSLAEGEAAFRPLCRLAEPLADLSGPMPFTEVQTFLDADYPNGRNYYWKSSYLDALTDEAIDSLLRHTETRPSPLTSIDVWFLGGALARVPAEATAFAQRQRPILIGVEANWDGAGATEANVGWARAVVGDMQRLSDGAAYLNFPGFSEEGEAQLAAAYGPNYARLRAIKAKYDPRNLFDGNLNIRPAG